jgi:glutamate dehydrogenase (NADP+)
VAQATTRKLIEMGAKVVTLSDSSGHIYDEAGIDADKLAFVSHLKNIRRGRISEYVDQYAHAVYAPAAPDQESNPLWRHRAQCAFPCATQNEINKQDAYHLINNNVKLVCEGASMPCTLDARDIFMDKGILYAPSKAANAGGVAVSGLELTQNSIRLSWLGEEVDRRLKIIMKGIHDTCLAAADAYGSPGQLSYGRQYCRFHQGGRHHAGPGDYLTKRPATDARPDTICIETCGRRFNSVRPLEDRVADDYKGAGQLPANA